MPLGPSSTAPVTSPGTSLVSQESAFARTPLSEFSPGLGFYALLNLLVKTCGGLSTYFAAAALLADSCCSFFAALWRPIAQPAAAPKTP